MTSFDRLWQAYGRLLHGFGIVAGLVTFAMMFLVVTNAVTRFLFNAPVQGAFEITQSMLTVLIFLSLATTQFHDGHIRVVLLTRRFPLPVQRAALAIAMLLGAAFFAWCSIAAWQFAMQSWAMNEQEWGTIRYPLYPVKFVVFLGVALLSLQFLLSAARAVVGPSANPGDHV